jgi:amino acid transporter
MGLSAFIIGSYKDRKKQIKFGWINMVAIVLLVVAFLVKAILFIPNFDSSNLLVLSIFGMSIFFFIIYLNLRAIMLIKKDEELVRSADRIR